MITPAVRIRIFETWFRYLIVKYLLPSVLNLLIHLFSVAGSIFVVDCNSPYDVITTPGTRIISPNYHGNYGHNLDCQVTITFEGRVSIEFEDFNLGPHGCNDWLKVYDGNNTDSKMIGQTLCNQKWGPNIGPMQSSGDSMTLLFHSDGDKSYRGFKILTG